MGNPVNWFEIAVEDLDRAKKFYQEVFGFEFQSMEMGPMTLEFFPANMEEYGATGALVKGEGYGPSSSGTVVYFNCEDLNTELAKVKSAGGTVLSEKTAIGEHGFVAHFRDSEGNHCALHSVK